MASVQSSTENQGFVQQFAELAWLDQVISFVFKLIAKLAELFLGFGLVASAIDYGSHGHLLASNASLMMFWVATQALALEGSGGFALALSFEAQAQGDHAKAWTQRCLALMLMAVGGVMFFSEMSAAAPGFKEVMSSPGYVYSMAALRTLVSLWYIAVCRTKDHRYSGTAQPQITAQPSQLQIDDVRNLVQAELTELRNAVQGQIKEIPAQINAAVAAQDYEVDPTKLSAQINKAVAHAVDQALRSAQRPAKNTDELAQRLPGKETAQIPALVEETEKRLRIQRYVAAQRAQGKEPTLEEIMEKCDCAKNTASKWRKAMEV